MPRSPMIPLAAVFLALTLPSPGTGQAREHQPEPARGWIAGTVTGSFQGTGAPLEGAVVEVRTAGFRSSTLTDSRGAYRLFGLPTGPLTLEVTRIGYEEASLTVLLAEGGHIVLDVVIEGRPISIRPLDVEGDPRLPDLPTVESASEQVMAVDLATVEASPVAVGAALAEVVEAIPGNDPVDPRDVLFMRGSTTDLKLVLLDGAPVFTPFHVAGILRSFQPEVMGSAVLHNGGAPARYDGGLTYILDLRTRRPRRDRVHGTTSVDLLSASATLEGPVGERLGFMASARGLLGEGLPSLTGNAPPYGYREGLASVEFQPGDGHLLRVTGFSNDESVNLVLPSSGASPSQPADGDARWGNRSLSLNYRGRVGPWALDVTGALTGYEAILPLQPSPTPEDPSPEMLIAMGQSRRSRLVAEGSRRTVTRVVRVGVSAETLWSRYSASYSGPDPVSSTVDTRGGAAGAYVDVSNRVARDVTLRVGLRADHFDTPTNPFRVAPRGAITWVVTPKAVLTVAAGRYHQYAQVADATLVEGVDQAILPTERGTILPVASSDHVVFSLDQALSDDVDMGFQGFWKKYSGLRGPASEPVLNSGVDLRVQHRGEVLTGWVGYGLSWFWSPTDFTGSQSAFAGRQLLNAGIETSAARMVSVGAKLLFGSGLPYTGIRFGDAQQAYPGLDDNTVKLSALTAQSAPLLPSLDDDFMRLDLEVRAHFSHRRERG
ncbi:MAG: TonB-dependent receptor, partial [Gemmatimonadota bacterium]|nr:TonB-dependent receptor [Gemmatimonadota bacterium]